MNNRFSGLFAFLAVMTSVLTARAEPLQTEVVSTAIIHLPIEEVFDFATTAGNWEKWHPNTFKAEGAVDHSAQPGEEIVETLKFLDIQGGQLFWIVTENVKNELWQLEGQNEDGSITFVLTYSFASTPEGDTQFKRTLVYEFEKNLLTFKLNLKLMWPFMTFSSQFAVDELKRVIETLDEDDGEDDETP